MNSTKDKYTDPQEHLSEAQIIRYQGDRMDSAEMHKVEEHTLSCAFCSDALEGYSMLDEQQTITSLADLNDRLANRLSEQKNKSLPAYWKWAVAASFLLLLSVAAFFVLNRFPGEQNIAQNRNSKEIKNRDESLSPKQKSAVHEENKTSAPEVASLEKAEEKGLVKESPATRPSSSAKQKNSGSQTEKRKKEGRDESHSTPLASGRGVIAEVEELDFTNSRQIAHNTRNQDKSNDQLIHNSTPGLEVESGYALSEKKESPVIRIRGIGSQKGILENRAGIITVEGVVRDAITGEPLPGVNIGLKILPFKTVTDLDGSYSLSLPKITDTLHLSYIGYEDKKILIGDSSILISTDLKPNTQALQEVVVVGYGTQKRSALSGSVSSVTLTDVEPPQPEKGMRRYNRYIKKNLKYPPAAVEAKKEGVVEVEFNVEADGSLDGFRPLTSFGFGMEEEAVRLIKEGPEWKPAVNKDGERAQGKAVVKIPFKLK